VLVAYFDEAGSFDRTDEARGETPVFAVGGYLAKAQQWEGFERAWVAVLYKHGVQGAFHMNQYESRKGQYGAWSNEKREEVIDELAEIINRHVTVGVGRAVVVSDYRALIRTGEGAGHRARTRSLMPMVHSLALRHPLALAVAARPLKTTRNSSLSASMLDVMTATFLGDLVSPCPS
jgi:hypothetical protein